MVFLAIVLCDLEKANRRLLERLGTTEIRQILTLRVRVTKGAAKIHSNVIETEQIYETIFRFTEY